MCGIAGVVSAISLGPEADRYAQAMLAKLSHRGPDGAHAKIYPSHGVVLGHTRLALNDLSESGRQPIWGVDGDHAITVSGEVYGFKQRRAELIAEGYRFRTKSDSEVALVLYQKHGLEFLEQLRGEFALALWDRARGRLILARDRFGVRPLVFCRSGDLLVWASEAKALFAHPAVPRRLDVRTALNQLCQVMVPGTTAFESVRSLMPGHVMIIDRTATGLVVTDRPYWDLSFRLPNEYDRAAAVIPTHIENIRKAVVESVSLRLDADVPVGVYLSGGLDSSSLLALVCGTMQCVPRALTIAFDDKQYDESALARRMADHVGIPLDAVRVGAADMYGAQYESAVWHSERSFYNTLGVAKMALSKHARASGLRAVITGEGADELFAGYPAFRIDAPAESMARGADSDSLFRGAILPVDPERHCKFDELCGFTPGWLQPWISTWRSAQLLLSADLRGLLAEYDPLEAVASSLAPEMIRGRSRLDIAQYTWIKTMLDGQILNWGGDKVDMANAIESRPVFLDHHLAQAAIAVPPELRIRDGVEKWILRQAMKGALPAFMFERSKFAFMGPPAFRCAQSTAALKRLTDKHLTSERVEAVGICDIARMRKFLDTVFTTDSSHELRNELDKIINHVLGLHILHEQYLS